MIKIRIAHVSDVHIGPYSGPFPLSRFQDINRILDWTADRIIEEKVDLCLVAGDCFKDARVMLDRASQEIASIVRFLRKLSNAGIAVEIISGTPSHDAVTAYELIKEMRIPRVGIATAPCIDILGEDVISKKIVSVQSIWGKGVMETSLSIACLPGLNRSMLMTQDEYKGLPPEQVHRLMTDKITQLCQGMSAQMPNDKPKILMAHMTYQGADTGFTDLLMQNEPILTREAVAGFDLVCLGHIHRPQIIDGKVFYSGPIERLSFNEEDIKPGFWIFDLDFADYTIDNGVFAISDKCKNRPMTLNVNYSTNGTGSNIDSVRTAEFVETPARRFYTIEWDETALIHFLNHGMNGFNSLFADDLKDAIVRLRYSCSEEIHKQLNHKALEKALYEAGSFFVAEIKAQVTRVDRARDSEVVESLSPVEALSRWAENQGIPAEESKVLQSMSAELLESGV